MPVFEIKQTAIFQKWAGRLKDRLAKAAIAARIFRLANGLPGDVQSVGDGVSELRIHYGPGYRVISSNVAIFWSFCCAGATSGPKVAILRPQNALQANGAMER